MVDSTKSFEVSNDGINVEKADGTDGVWLGGGDAIPTHVAVIGSIYLRTNGDWYKQAGPSTTDWEIFEPAGDGLAGTRVSFWSDGSSYNEWLKRDNNHTKESGPSSKSDAEPWTFPFNGKITTLTFMNKKEGADADIEIYKNGTLQDTWEVRNKKWATNTSLTPITFSAGDHLSIFSNEFGGGEKPDDLLIDVFIAFTDSTAQILGGSTL